MGSSRDLRAGVVRGLLGSPLGDYSSDVLPIMADQDDADGGVEIEQNNISVPSQAPLVQVQQAAPTKSPDGGVIWIG